MVSVAVVARFVRSVWHTRRSQLLWRAWISLRRKWSSYFCRPVWFSGEVNFASPVPVLAAPLAAPVTRSEGGVMGCVICNQWVAISFPFNWDVPGITVGRPLARLEVHYLDWTCDLGGSVFMRIVNDWVASNWGFSRSVWGAAWNSYGLSTRVISLMRGLVARDSALSVTERDFVGRCIVSQLLFLEQNLERDLGGNHLLRNLAALYWGARMFSGRVAHRWLALAESLLACELHEQFLWDGLHFERSPSYLKLTLVDLLDIHSLMQEGALRQCVLAALVRGGQALADLTHPDGLVSLFNDCSAHKGADAGRIVAAIEVVAGISIRQRGVFGFLDAGYFGFRGGLDLFLVDCGKIAPDHLPAHGHGDILSFEWSVEGKRFVTDFGVYEYTAGPWRELSRATRSHNTVTVGDGDQCEFWSSFRVGRRAKILKQEFEPRDDGFVLRGAHDGYSHLPGRPVHERSFDVDRDGAVIRDEVRGGRGQAVRARLLFHPDCRLQLEAGRLVAEQGGTRITVEFECQGRLEDSWWCPDFGVKHKAQQLVLEYGAAPCVGGFRLRKCLRDSIA